MSAEELRLRRIEMENSNRQMIAIPSPPRQGEKRKMPPQVLERHIAGEPWFHVVRAIKQHLGLVDEDLDVGVDRATGRYGDSLTNYLRVVYEIAERNPELYKPAVNEALHFIREIALLGVPEKEAIHNIASQYSPEERRIVKDIIKRFFPDYDRSRGGTVPTEP